MIFNAPGHIDMIRREIKTQTRRLNRGIYQVGKDYAVQAKGGMKAEPDIRIVIDEIWLETRGIVLTNYFLECKRATLGEGILYVRDIPISNEDALAEGGYTPEEYELAFRKAYPKWDGKTRWVFRFCVIGVPK